MTPMHERAAADAATAEFDPSGLRRDGNKGGPAALGLWLLNQPWFMALFRTFWPVANVAGLTWITRYDDVREALSRPDVFQVPFGTKMNFLVPTSCPFVLGIDGGEAYERGLRAIMAAFPLDKLDPVKKIAATEADAILAQHSDRIDAISELMTKVPVRICQEYYGLDTSAPDFALWLIAMSNYTFRKIGADAVARRAAEVAAPKVMAVVDGAIRRAQAGGPKDTVVGRFLHLQQKARAAGCDGLPDDALPSSIIGMTIGFVATATMAGGHILEVLLRRKDAMAASVQAARDDDDDLLARCLLEALRFYPINPGPWRLCVEDYTFAASSLRRLRVRKGRRVLVGTQSAMRDPRRVPNPGSFDPNRSAKDSMVFGTGLHWCVGAPLAIIQMTQTFKPLLRRAPVRRVEGAAGRTRYFGAFPETLMVTLGRPR